MPTNLTRTSCSPQMRGRNQENASSGQHGNGQSLEACNGWSRPATASRRRLAAIYPHLPVAIFWPTDRRSRARSAAASDAIESSQRHPQEAVLDDARQRFDRRAVFRQVAHVFPGFRRSVALQCGGPRARLAGLEIKTALMKAAHETEIVGQPTVAREYSPGRRPEGASLVRVPFFRRTADACGGRNC